MFKSKYALKTNIQFCKKQSKFEIRLVKKHDKNNPLHYNIIKRLAISWKRDLTGKDFYYEVR